MAQLQDSGSDFLDEGGDYDDDAAYEARLQAEGGLPPEEGQEQPQGQQQEQVAQAQEQAGQAAQEGEERKPQQHPEGYVRVEALHEARLQNQEIREQLRSMEAKFGVLDNLRSQLEEYRNRDKQEQAQQDAKRFEDDPMGYMREQVEKTQSEVRETKLTIEQQRKVEEEQRQYQEQIQAFQRTIEAQVTEFIAKQPDYPDAFKYLISAREKEMRAVGITSQSDIARALDQEAMSLAQIAIQNGRNPGEAAYALAVARGYTPNNTQGEGATATVNEDTLAKQLDKLEKGQQASQTLSGGGKIDRNSLSLSDIDNMPDADFEALWGEMSREAGSGDIFDG